MTITLTGIIIAVILIIFFVFGMKTGLIKSVFDLLAFFLTWALTWIFYPHLAALLLNTPIYEGVNKWLTLTLNNNDLVSESLPEFFVNLPNFIKDSIVISSKQAFESLISSTVDALTVLTMNIISIIVLYFLFRFISHLIKKAGNKINKIMIIGPVNMLLGGAFGVIRGLFVVYISMMLISYFPTTKIYDFTAKDIERSYICSKMFNEDIKFLGLSVRYPVKEE